MIRRIYEKVNIRYFVDRFSFFLNSRVFCYVGKVWGSLQNAKSLIYGIAGLITWFSIYCLWGRLNGTPSTLVYIYPRFIGIAFPLLFYIERKDIRNVIMTLAIIVVLLTKQWLSLGCISIAYIVIFWEHKRVLALIALVIGLTFAPMLYKFVGVNNPMTELKSRIVIYEQTLDKTTNVWWGHGFGSFKKIPENQAENRPSKLWLARSHSDFLQGLYEFGLIRMTVFMLIILFPLIWLKANPLSASYLCVLLNSFLDFPFHRWGTGVLCVIVIFMLYRRNMGYDK